MRRRAGLVTGVLLLAAVTAGPERTPLRAAEPARLALPASPLSEDERVLHALNRLGYGPRPGDPARIKSAGLAAYIEGQLHPERSPASKCATGTLAFAATTEQAKVEFTSPATSTRLGRRSATSFSNASMMRAVCSAWVPEPDPK